MTDVSNTGRRRGIPLRLEDNVLDLIAAGRDDLRDSDGKPVPSRIAEAAGLYRQRLSPMQPTQDPWTMGALIRYYAISHGISNKEAIAALLCLDEPETVAA